MNVPTAQAMQIAGVNRVRFNEAVSAGWYRCAPTTPYRRSRSFDLSDMLGLYAFGELSRGGLSYRVSAELACTVVDLHRSHGNDLVGVVIAREPSGTQWIGPWFGEGKAGNRINLRPFSDAYLYSQYLNIALMQGKIEAELAATAEHEQSEDTSDE